MGSTAEIGIFTTDRALVVRSWDDWLATATGISRDRAIGQRLADLLPEVEARGFLPRFHEALHAGTVHVLSPALHQYLIPCPPRTASPRFERMQQHVTIGPLRDDTGTVGVVVAIEDVTTRLDAERALAQALTSDDEAERRSAKQVIADSRQPQSAEAFAPALSADNWRVRQAAVQGLASSADQQFMQSLVASLRQEHRDFALLSSALKLLAVTNVNVTGPLTELLKDPDPDLRIQAALALGEQHDASAVPPLIDALQDSDANVRFQAIESLGRLRAEPALDALLSIVESRDFFLAFAALDAVAAIHDARAAPRLVPLLAVETLRVPVADALGAIGDDQVVPDLVAALNRSERAAVSIAVALARIHDRVEAEYHDGARIAELTKRTIDDAGTRHVVNGVANARDEELPGLVRVLGWIEGHESAQTLTRLLGEPAVRAAVIEALIRHGEGVIDLLIAHTRSDDRETRHAAVAALGRLGSRRATPALLQLLEGEHDLLVAVCGALARIADRDAFEPLLGLLGHSDASVRQSAIGALNSMGHPELPHRIQQLLDDADPIVRESAVRVAGYFGYPQTIDRLFACVSDGHEPVRRAALEHLGFLDDRRVLPALRHALGHDTPPARAAAARSLARIADPAAAAALRDALEDADSWVRYFAARGLAECRDQQTAAVLVHHARHDPAIHVRIAAIDALGALRALDRVADLKGLTSDPHEEVAAAALGALGRLAAADGLSELVEALRSDSASRRTAAVRALAAHGSTDAVSSLEWTASADPDPAVARSALEALAMVAATTDGPAARAAIDALLLLLTDAGRREAAANALAALPAARIQDLARGLRHPQTEVRTRTIEALGRLQHPEASRLIVEALADASPSVREAAIVALTRLGARGVEPTIADLAARDSSKAVRRAATAALARLRA